MLENDVGPPRLRPEGEMKTEIRFENVFEEHLDNLFRAEQQIVDALPKMIAKASSEELAGALQEHLDQTKEQVTRLAVILGRAGEQPGAKKCPGMEGKETEVQVSRLEQIAKILGITASGKKCIGMEGCIQEGAEALDEKGEEPILDLGRIAAASRVEHYEIAGYMTAIALAERLGKGDVVALLESSLSEEQAADQKLQSIAGELIKDAPTKELAKGHA